MPIYLYSTLDLHR